MRAALGRLISPESACSSPRMILNSVDLPTPLRPTSPTLAPTGSDTDAPSKNFRPQPLKTRLSIWSMELRRDPSEWSALSIEIGGRWRGKCCDAARGVRRYRALFEVELLVLQTHHSAAVSRSARL